MTIQEKRVIYFILKTKILPSKLKAKAVQQLSK